MALSAKQRPFQVGDRVRASTPTISLSGRRERLSEKTWAVAGFLFGW